MMISLALWFIALGLGWQVFSAASELKDPGRRSAGRAIGLYVLTVALLATLYLVAECAMRCKAMAGCPVAAKWCRLK